MLSDLVAAGKHLKCVDEDWERVYRQAATCVHGLVTKLCKHCYRPLPAYWPN